MSSQTSGATATDDGTRVRRPLPSRLVGHPSTPLRPTGIGSIPARPSPRADGRGNTAIKEPTGAVASIGNWSTSRAGGTASRTASSLSAAHLLFQPMREAPVPGRCRPIAGSSTAHPLTYDSFSQTLPARTRKISTPRTCPSVPFASIH